MTPLVFLAVVVAGGVGAGLRYLVDVLMTAWVGGRFPWGIFVANVTGSFALGILTGVAPAEDVSLVLGLGLLGGYTTFSTVSVTTVLLLEDRLVGPGLFNALGTLAATIAAAWLGLAVGGAVS